jgi:hypothetical protein
LTEDDEVLCDLCVSVVYYVSRILTTEAQRAQRMETEMSNEVE